MNSQISFSNRDRQSAEFQDAVEDGIAKFINNGTLLIRSAFPKQLVESIGNAFEMEYGNLTNRELKARDAIVGDQRFMISIKIKKQFNDASLFASPRLMPILESLLSKHLRIASFGAVVAQPGASDQAIHLDHPPLFDDDSLCDPMPPYAITLVVPLVDVTGELGPTAIWPGSHRGSGRLGRLQQLMQSPDFSEADRPLTQMGDCYLMDYRVVHGAMANYSQQVRPILYIVYGRPWFRDGFNFQSQPPVQISDKQRKKVPKRFRGLFCQ